MPLDPNAAQILRFLEGAFPDLGGEVVNAVVARRKMAAIGFPRGPEVAQLGHRSIPGAPGGPEVPVRIWPGCRRRW